MGQGQAVVKRFSLGQKAHRQKDEALRAGNCGCAEAVCVGGGGWYGRGTLSPWDRMKRPVPKSQEAGKNQESNVTQSR